MRIARPFCEDVVNDLLFLRGQASVGVNNKAKILFVGRWLKAVERASEHTGKDVGVKQSDRHFSAFPCAYHSG